MQNEDVKALSERSERALTPRIAKVKNDKMQNEDVKVEERPKEACLDASYCKGKKRTRCKTRMSRL